MDSSTDNNRNKPINPDEVYQEQAMLLFKALPTSIVGTLLGISFVLLIMWPAIPHQTLFIWTGLFILVTLIRLVQSLKVLRHKHHPPDLRLNVRYFTIGAMAAAIMWAASSVFLFPANDPVRQVILAFILSTTSAIAISNFASMKRIAFSFVFIISIPLAIRFFMSQTETHTFMGIMIILSFFLFLFVASRSNRAIVGHIKSSHEAKESEHQLRQSQQKLALHIQRTPLAVIEWSPELDVTEWNTAAEKMFAYTREEAIGKNAYDLVIPKNIKKYTDEIKTELTNRSGGLYSINENKTKDGRIILCEWFNTPLVDDKGETIGIASLARDVTERIRLDRLKDEFVSTVSHELRTPLTSLCGSIGLLLGGTVGKLPEKANDLLEIANNNAGRLKHLINDILDIQKIEAGQIQYKLQNIEIAKLVEQTIKDNAGYALQRKIQLKLANTENNTLVYVDKVRLSQVLDNLISNAIKFSQEKAIVDINISPQNTHVRVSVQDYGVGVPKEFRPHLFERFTQNDASASRDFAGTGLGLSIAKGIIEQHHGRIGYQPVHDGGSNFYFDLPVHATS